MNKDYNEFIREYAIGLRLPVYEELIHQYPQFLIWSGSHHASYHHYGNGGLIRHTYEVIDYGLSLIENRFGANIRYKIDSTEYFFAALFHDVGKMMSLEKVTNAYSSTWGKTHHSRLIHHLPQSALIWHDIINKFPELSKQYHDLVLHAILAHHGSREAGSPVAPKSRVAWLVHLCDGISARMDDADTTDVVENK